MIYMVTVHIDIILPAYYSIRRAAVLYAALYVIRPARVYFVSHRAACARRENDGVRGPAVGANITRGAIFIAAIWRALFLHKYHIDVDLMLRMMMMSLVKYSFSSPLPVFCVEECGSDTLLSPAKTSARKTDDDDNIYHPVITRAGKR